MKTAPSLAAVCLTALLASTSVARAAGPRPGSYAEVEPLLAKYCYDCHGDGSTRGDVALDAHPSDAARVADTKLWARAFEQVRSEVMPPPRQPQPTAAERAKIAGWIDREVFRVDCRAPDPGRVTTRRLNRQEYANTIRDLLGVEFNTREEFPPDDSGYGFDNIGDVLSMSPMLMEKYFVAAEQISRKAIVVGKPPLPRQVVSGADLESDEEAPPGVKVREARLDIKRPGRYTLTINVNVQSFDPFPGKVRFAATLDGRPLVARVYRTGNRAYPYKAVRTLSAGEHRVKVRLDVTQARGKRDQGVSINVEEVAAAGPIGGEPVYPLPHRRIFFEGPAPKPAAARRQYTREILQRLADRAFRRPVDEPSLDRLVALATGVAGQTKSFEEGIAQALQAILVSPRFLFRAETQPRPDDPLAIHPLDEHALASRLSYWLWTSAPDDELTALAKAGHLRTSMPAQVQRMLADAKAERFVSDFVGQWLQTRDVEGISIDPLQFPTLTGGIRKSMRRETELLFAHILREDRDAREILTADYTFLDGPLAKFYGVDGVRGGKMRKVQLPADGPRGGVLTHGSFLVVTSNPTRTSPVKRGLFVLDNLLGTPPPPPPPDIPNLEDAAAKDGRKPKTVREQLAIHREDAGCASCHARMDPIGLGLENFSLIGQWRELEEDKPIDARGELVSGEKFAGVKELRTILGSRRAPFYRALTGKLMTYALGRGLEAADRCTVDEITNRMLTGGGRLSTAILGIIESPAFQRRRGDGAALATAQQKMRTE